MIYIICLQGISDQNNNIKTANNRANAKKKQTNKKKKKHHDIKYWQKCGQIGTLTHC